MAAQKPKAEKAPEPKKKVVDQDKDYAGHAKFAKFKKEKGDK